MNKYRFKLRLLPSIFFTAVVILIIRAHSYSLDFSDIADVPLEASSTQWDIFCYVKAEAIFLISIIAAVTMIYLLITKKLVIKKTRIYIPMLIYTALVVISYICSDYKWLSFLGSKGRFEGTRTILCYMFMLFYTINVIDEYRNAIIIAALAMVSALLTCIIGLTQLLSCDILLSEPVKWLVAGHNDMMLGTSFKPGQVYQTVANMDNVGMYLSLLLPLVCYSIYYFGVKKNRLKLAESGINNKRCLLMVSLSGLLLLLIILNMIGAGSLGGLVGSIASLSILVLMTVKKKTHRAVLSVVFLAVIVGTLAFVYVRGVDDHEKTGHKQIDFIETGVDRVNMSINGNAFSIKYHREEDTYEVTDDKDKSLAIFYFADEEGVYNIEDSRFGVVKVMPFNDVNGEACVVVEIRDNDWDYFGFTFYEDGAKFMNPFGEEISLSKVDSFLFDKHLSAGSGRGYIWSRTLPLLKERILLGSGADTFLAVFPNYDYAGKYSAGMSQQLTIDKAHSLYLGMAVGSGVLSVIAFLAMVLMVLIRAFNSSEDRMIEKIIAAGVIGFLVAGLFCDSSVGTMPMFYGLFGSVAALSICERASQI